MAVSVETADIIFKHKKKGETQDAFIKRMFEEWRDLKEYRLDMDVVLKLKERQISNLETELLSLKNNSSNNNSTDVMNQ
jgi:hypothetical protein